MSVTYSVCRGVTEDVWWRGMSEWEDDPPKEGRWSMLWKIQGGFTYGLFGAAGVWLQNRGAEDVLMMVLGAGIGLPILIYIALTVVYDFFVRGG